MGEKTQGGINMPDKESFTFSDKLRKSKSVPLSKRLPSIVGGQNKQKRTLVQRAQRDLPFILVAALALLLLPFLSRTGSDDIASTDNIAWNTLGGDETSFAEGGGAEIMPAGTMKDPLDWIIGARSDVEKTAATVGTDASKSAYGSETGSRSNYGKTYGTGDGSSYGRSKSSSYSGTTSTKKPAKSDYNSSRKGYEETYTTRTTKKPATEKYKQTRAAVRKSFERKGTDINRALRLSQLPSGKGGSGVSHALPLGQGPGRTPNTSFREGIRPVALQPMEAHGGVGRSMTGENLYAEAARSIREMNAGGPAKQNLLAAQMRDVDGQLTPEGPGGFGAGASVRPGAGGNGPGNNNGYNIGKPWWWDMMQARSQKMWDLLYYKPREIFWNNIYNYMSQLMNCLATGNKDGDVSTMFGKKAGTDDYICKKEGIPSLQDYMEYGQHSTQTKEGGKETGYSISPKEWFDLCGEGNYVKDPSSRKSFWKVRFECVGLDYGAFKSWFKAKEYGADCFKVNSDPMELTYTVTKNGKDRERLENKAVIALVAKVKDPNAKAEKHFGHILEAQRNFYYSLKDQEIVIYAQMGNKFSMTQEEARSLYNPDICSLTKIIAFVPRADKGAVENNLERANFTKEFDSDAYHKKHPQVVDRDGNPELFYGVGEGVAKFVHGDRVNNWARFRGQIEAARKVCNGEYAGDDDKAHSTTADVHPLTYNSIFDIADFVSQDGLLNSGVKKNSLKICSLWGEKPKFAKFINNVACEDCANTSCIKQVDILDNVTFKAKISNSKDKHVYAVLIDHIDQQTKAKVTTIADFGASGSAGGRTCTEGTNDCTYEFNIDIATLGLNPNGLMTGEVKTLPSNYSPTPAVTSGDARVTTSQAIDANYRQNTDINAKLKQEYDECVEGCKTVEGRTSKTRTTVDGKVTETVTTMSEAECKIKCHTQFVQGDQTGLNGSSSESGVQTARGSGMIFWIVAEGDVTFKVQEGGDLAGNLWSVKIEDLIESTKAVMFEVCRYRWCNGIGRCNARPQDQAQEFCVEDGKLFSSEKVTINGKVYNIKTTEAPFGPASSPSPYPKCDNLCRGTDGLHECDKERIPEDPPICLNGEDGCDYPVKPCHGCCIYNDINYKSVILEDGNHYIIDATENACTNAKEQCTVAAWSEENGKFAVYSMEDYDPTKLPLIPEDNRFLKAKWKNSYEVGLSTEYTEDYTNEFELIKQQSKNYRYNKERNTDPQLFKLFPLLKLPDEIELNLVETCNICKKSMYDNADVRAHEKVITEVSEKMESCFRQVQKIESALGSNDEDVKTLKSIYFYGYASKRGSHKPKELLGANGSKKYNVGCTTSGADPDKTETDEDDERWGYCNKALSEDRNLYIMDKVLGKIGKEFEISVSKEKDYTTPKLLKGFTNTKGPVNRTRGSATFRLIKQPKASGDEFAFISYPCGSDGAPAKTHYNTIESQAEDRYVLITPIKDETKDYCVTRMTCDNSKAEMTAIEKRIKTKLKNKGITSLPLAVVTPPTGSLTVTEDNDSSILDEEIAESDTGELRGITLTISGLHDCASPDNKGEIFAATCNHWYKQSNEYLGITTAGNINNVADTISRKNQLLNRYPQARKWFADNEPEILTSRI